MTLPPYPISASAMRLFREAPAHYHHRYIAGNRSDDIEAEREKAFGRALHVALLEPAKFTQKIAVAPVCDRRTSDGKAMWADYLAASVGKTLIPNQDAETIMAMRAKAMRHPLVARYLRAAGAEKEVRRKFQMGGLPCLYIPDYEHIEARVILDVKSTKSAHPALFSRDARNHGYLNAAAWYIQGWMETQGTTEMPYFAWVAIEKKPPYIVEFYTPPVDALTKAMQENTADLARLANCLETNEWPGYTSGEATELHFF
jgi:hypothetical protein